MITPGAGWKSSPAFAFARFAFRGRQVAFLLFQRQFVQSFMRAGIR